MTLRPEQPPLSPGAKRAARAVGFWAGGTLLTAVILGPAPAKVFTFAVGFYWVGQAVVWATRHDYRESRSRRVDAFDPEQQLDKDFLREWKKIEDEAKREHNREIARDAARKSKEKKRPIANQYGDLMNCLMCGEQANERGRFCDRHDDQSDNPFYDRPD